MIIAADAIWLRDLEQTPDFQFVSKKKEEDVEENGSSSWSCE
jgi:hypothetical protein